MLQKFAGIVLIVGIVMCTGVVSAQETYELKSKWSKGDKRTVESIVECEIKTCITSADGIMQEGKGQMSLHEKFAEEILDAKDGKIVKAQRKYHFSRETRRFSDRVSGPTSYTDLHGKLYEVVVTDGKVEVKCLNAEMGDHVRKKLENLYKWGELADGVLPKKTVSVGESWEIDTDTLAVTLPGDLVVAEVVLKGRGIELSVTRATGTLVAIEEYEGTKCAKIAYEFEMVMVESVGDTEFRRMTMPVKGTVYFALDAGKWIYMELSGTMEFTRETERETEKGEGKFKMVRRVQLGVADLEGGEAPVEDDPDDEGG